MSDTPTDCSNTLLYTSHLAQLKNPIRNWSRALGSPCITDQAAYKQKILKNFTPNGLVNSYVTKKERYARLAHGNVRSGNTYATQSLNKLYTNPNIQNLSFKINSLFGTPSVYIGYPVIPLKPSTERCHNKNNY